MVKVDLVKFFGPEMLDANLRCRLDELVHVSVFDRQVLLLSKLPVFLHPLAVPWCMIAPTQ